MKKRSNFLMGIFLVGALLFSPVHLAHAQYWGESITAAFIKQQLEEAYNLIQGTLLGSLKVAAYKTLSQQINSIISGRGGGGFGGGGGVGAQFITNWENFLYREAMYRAQVTMNDFYTLSLRGMGVNNTYVAANSPLTQGSQPNWPMYLRQTAQQVISEKVPQYNLNRYCSDPSVMFSSKDLRCLNAYVQPMNNPYGFSIEAKSKYEAEIQKNIEIAKTQAVAYQGYKGVTDKEGNTLTPGSTIASIQSSMNSHLLGLPLSAKNPAEIAAITASTFVNSLLQQAVQQGMARVESEVNGKIATGMNALTSKLGPGAQFLPLNQIYGDLIGTPNRVTRWSLGGESPLGPYTTPIVKPPVAVPGDWKNLAQ